VECMGLSPSLDATHRSVSISRRCRQYDRPYALSLAGIGALRGPRCQAEAVAANMLTA